MRHNPELDAILRDLVRKADTLLVSLNADNAEIRVFNLSNLDRELLAEVAVLVGHLIMYAQPRRPNAAEKESHRLGVVDGLAQAEGLLQNFRGQLEAQGAPMALSLVVNQASARVNARLCAARGDAEPIKFPTRERVPAPGPGKDGDSK